MSPRTAELSNVAQAEAGWRATLGGILELHQAGIDPATAMRFRRRPWQSVVVQPKQSAATVGLDQMGLGSIVDILAERGIEGDDRVVGVSQGWKLAGAILTAGRKLADGSLIHAAQPMMAWMVSNARIEPKGNAVTITKQTSGAAKIDGLIALLCAVQIMSLNPEAICPKTVYDDGERGLLVL